MWLTCVKHKCMYILYEWMHSHSSISGPLAYSKHLAFAIREPNKNTLSYQSVSIIMVSQFFFVPGANPVDMAFFCRETSDRKKEMTWQKWVTRQRWMDRWDPWGVFTGDSMSCLQKRMMFKVKKATPKNTWRVL